MEDRGSVGREKRLAVEKQNLHAQMGFPSMGRLLLQSLGCDLESDDVSLGGRTGLNWSGIFLGATSRIWDGSEHAAETGRSA